MVVQDGVYEAKMQVDFNMNHNGKELICVAIVPTYENQPKTGSAVLQVTGK